MTARIVGSSKEVTDRERLGLRECSAASLLGLTVCEYRALEAGDRVPDADTYARIVDVFGWPESYWPPKLRANVQ